MLAADPLEHLFLLWGLDALGQRGEPEGAAERDDRGGQGRLRSLTAMSSTKDLSTFRTSTGKRAR